MVFKLAGFGHHQLSVGEIYNSQIRKHSGKAFKEGKSRERIVWVMRFLKAFFDWIKLIRNQFVQPENLKFLIMKKIVFVVLLAVLAIGSSYAQPGGDPTERLKRELDGLTTELGLTTDQLAKVTPIVTEAQKKHLEAFAKMREEGNMDRDKMREERTKMQAETDKQLKAVLTPEQGVKLDAYRKKQAEERAKRMQQMGQ